MANFKKYNYAQRVMIPISFEEQIIPGTLEYAIHVAIENHLDLSCFESKFSNDTIGRPAYNPKILLKLILLAYSRGITSSRKIEQMCHENVLFMAMTCDQKCDHTTISTFVSSMGDEIHSVFLGVLLICEKLGLLGGTLFALDGTKIPGNASKEMSGTRQELKHKQKLMRGRLKRLIKRHQATDAKERAAADPGNKHFKRQKTKLERTIKKITRFLKTTEPRTGKQRRELKANVTDPDSAKMKTSGGTIQGYNAQAFADSKHQIIVAATTTNNCADNDNFKPMVQELKKNLKTIGFSEKALQQIITTSDSGFYSSDNIKFAEEEKITAYLPDNQFRSRDPRYANQMKYRVPTKFTYSDFRYDEATDSYHCPGGKVLTSYGKNVKRGDHFIKQYVAKVEVCQGCDKKANCLMTKRARRKTLQFKTTGDTSNYVDFMKRRVDSDEGRKIYSRRFAIIEPVFANIKHQKGLRRFNFRGKIKATTQWLLWCMVHNLEKIANCGKLMR